MRLPTERLNSIFALEAGRARLWAVVNVQRGDIDEQRSLSCCNNYCQGEWGLLTRSCSAAAPRCQRVWTWTGYLLERAPLPDKQRLEKTVSERREQQERCCMRSPYKCATGDEESCCRRTSLGKVAPSGASPRPKPCRPAGSARGLWPGARWFCRRAARWRGCISPARRHSAGAAGCCTTLGGRRTPGGGRRKNVRNVAPHISSTD